MKKRMRVNSVVLSFVLCLVAISIVAVSSAPIDASLVADLHADERADLALQLGDQASPAETLDVGEGEIVARGGNNLLTAAGKAFEDSATALRTPSLAPIEAEASASKVPLLRRPWLMHQPSLQSSRFSSMPPPARLPRPITSSAQASFSDGSRFRNPWPHVVSGSYPVSVQPHSSESLKRSFTAAELDSQAATQQPKKIMDPNGPSFHLSALTSKAPRVAVHEGSGTSSAMPPPAPHASLKMKRTRKADTSTVPQALPRAIDSKRLQGTLQGTREDKANNEFGSARPKLSKSRQAINVEASRRLRARRAIRAPPAVLTPVQQALRDSPLAKAKDRAAFDSQDGRKWWQAYQRVSQRHSKEKKKANLALGQAEGSGVPLTQKEINLRDSEFATEDDKADIDSGDYTRSSRALRRVRDKRREGITIRIETSQHLAGSGTKSIDPSFARLLEDDLPTSPRHTVQPDVHHESQDFHPALSGSGAQQTPHDGSTHPHAPPSTPNIWDELPNIADLS